MGEALTAAAVLLALPWAPGSADEVDDRALDLLDACGWGWGPTEAPAGEDCVIEVAVLWHIEARLSEYPPARGHGCGPLQVVEARLGNGRIGRLWTPPCTALRVPRVGLEWGVYLLRLKARFGSWRARSRAYNGSSRRDEYSRRAGELLDRVRAAVEGRET